MLSIKHHQSTGHYFSWGNRGNYGMVGNSSVVQYASKGVVTSNLNSKFIDYMMNSELQAGITNLKKDTAYLAFGCSTNYLSGAWTAVKSCWYKHDKIIWCKYRYMEIFIKYQYSIKRSSHWGWCDMLNNWYTVA